MLEAHAEALITERYERSMTVEIISRADARANGLKRFFTGKPCTKCHLDQRFVSSGHCVACSEINYKKWSALNQEKRKQIGRKSYAKNAERRNEASRQYYKDNTERLREGARIRAAKRWEENKDLVLEQGKRWRADNIEQVRAAQRKRAVLFRKENPELARSRVADWEKRNRQVVREYTRKRRAMRLAASGSHTLEDLQEIMRLQRNRCAYCRGQFGPSLKPALDHIIALSRGGSEDRKNLQYLCQSCNSKKNNLDPIEYAKKIGRLV